MRLLFARIGTPHCPTHGKPLVAQTISQMIHHVMQLPDDSKMMVLAPIVRDRKGEHQQLLDGLLSQGFLRAKINGKIHDLEDKPNLNPKQKHSISIVVDRLIKRQGIEKRLSESLETALRLAKGIVTVETIGDNPKENPKENPKDNPKDNHAELVFSENHSCIECGFSITDLEPKLFSFNNPAGACSDCDGIGHVDYFDASLVVS